MERPCPHCGGKIPGPAEAAALAAQVPVNPSLAAGEAVRAKRLAACGICDALREGVLCAHCGCFVVFRSRPAKSYCPHPAGDKWPHP